MVLVVVVVGCVLVGGGQVSWMLFTPGGSFRVEGETPGGRWKYSFLPVTSVTTTVHSAADATGSAAMLSSASMEAALTAPTAILRLLQREANLLPPLGFNNLVCVLRRSAGRPGSHWLHATLTTQSGLPEATDWTLCLQRGTVSSRGPTA